MLASGNCFCMSHLQEQLLQVTQTMIHLHATIHEVWHCFSMPVAHIRKQILQTRGLTREDFSSPEEMKNAADVLIKNFQDSYPEKVAEHPSRLVEGMDQLDQFWFAEYKGIWGSKPTINYSGSLRQKASGCRFTFKS